MSDTVDLTELKTYLRIDGGEDDQVLASLYDAAVEYLENAGVKKSEDKHKLYDLAIKLLVSHWYDNRSGVIVGITSKSLEHSLQSIILQLKVG